MKGTFYATAILCCVTIREGSLARSARPFLAARADALPLRVISADHRRPHRRAHQRHRARGSLQVRGRRRPPRHRPPQLPSECVTTRPSFLAPSVPVRSRARDSNRTRSIPSIRARGARLCPLAPRRASAEARTGLGRIARILCFSCHESSSDARDDWFPYDGRETNNPSRLVNIPSFAHATERIFTHQTSRWTARRRTSPTP